MTYATLLMLPAAFHERDSVSARFFAESASNATCSADDRGIRAFGGHERPPVELFTVTAAEWLLAFVIWLALCQRGLRLGDLNGLSQGLRLFGEGRGSFFSFTAQSI